jgi:hypothetical protein
MVDWPEPVKDLYFQNLKNSYENGNHEALLIALSECVRSNVEIPEWVKTSFLSSIKKWQDFENKSLDDAFCVTRKNLQLPAQRKKLQHQGDIYLRMCSLIGENMTVEDALEIVTNEYPVAHTLAKQYYYEIKNIIGNTNTCEIKDIIVNTNPRDI